MVPPEVPAIVVSPSPLTPQSYKDLTQTGTVGASPGVDMWTLLVMSLLFMEIDALGEGKSGAAESHLSWSRVRSHLQ